MSRPGLPPLPSKPTHHEQVELIDGENEGQVQQVLVFVQQLDHVTLAAHIRGAPARALAGVCVWGGGAHMVTLAAHVAARTRLQVDRQRQPTGRGFGEMTDGPGKSTNTQTAGALTDHQYED